MSAIFNNKRSISKANRTCYCVTLAAEFKTVLYQIGTITYLTPELSVTCTSAPYKTLHHPLNSVCGSLGMSSAACAIAVIGSADAELVIVSLTNTAFV